MMSQSHQAPRGGYDRPGEESPRTRRGRRGGKRRRRDRSSSPPRVPAIEPARGYQPQLPPRGYAMAPRGWEPRRFAQPESLAQLPPPARARVTPGEAAVRLKQVPDGAPHLVGGGAHRRGGLLTIESFCLLFKVSSFYWEFLLTIGSFCLRMASNPY